MAFAELRPDPVDSAHVAGLRYVDADLLPGLRRVGSGRRFAYLDARGRRVTDPATLDRIRKLVIPPAWTQVWICPEEAGHLQAVGRDARGRKQYRYHARWREVRDAAKFHKMLAFAHVLPRIRAACERDLRLSGLPRDKVLATAVRLLETTHVRIGNEEYTRANGSYGLTTLTDRHVRVLRAEVHFHFRGKAGKIRDVGVHDRRLARIVAQCSDLPGHELFQYVDDDGRRHCIDSADVNAYIARIASADFTAKDFRTWAGTLLAAQTLRASGPCSSRTHGHASVVECIKQVAARLGNTPAVCKRCYVHPAVVDAYLDGSIRGIRVHSPERLVCTLITRAARRRAPSRPAGAGTRSARST